MHHIRLPFAELDDFLTTVEVLSHRIPLDDTHLLPLKGDSAHLAIRLRYLEGVASRESRASSGKQARIEVCDLILAL